MSKDDHKIDADDRNVFDPCLWIHLGIAFFERKDHSGNDRGRIDRWDRRTDLAVDQRRLGEFLGCDLRLES